MKFSASLVLAASAAAVNARVIAERQLIAPQVFGLKLVSPTNPQWNGKFVHPAPLGTSSLSVSSTTSFADMTFMLIGSNLFHGSDAVPSSSFRSTPDDAGAPITAAAVPSFFKSVDTAKTPLYFAPVSETQAGGVSSTTDGFEVAGGFALTKDGKLTHDGNADWIACDGQLGGGEFGRISGLYLSKGDVPETTGCKKVQVVKV